MVIKGTQMNTYRLLRLLILMCLIAVVVMLVFGCGRYYCDPEPDLIATANKVLALAANPQNKAPPRSGGIIFIRPDNPREVAIFEAGRKRGIEECERNRQ
jgi:hypothetical protein